MKICILGDSVAKGILYNEADGRYVCGKNGFAARLAADGAEVDNISVFGCTVTKGLQLAQRHIARLESADVILLEFGGNDCDFHWDQIAADPDAHHEPNTSMERYLENYTKLIYLAQGSGAVPLVLNLPPIGAKRYFNRFSAKMDDGGKKNIIRWLGGDVEYIHRWHKTYNDQLWALAGSLGIPTADIRGEFRQSADYNDFLCRDGIHPNEEGQTLIYKKLRSLVPSLPLKKTIANTGKVWYNIKNDPRKS